MTLQHSEVSRRTSVSAAFGLMLLASASGCSILFDSPSADDVASVSIDDVMVRKAREARGGAAFPVGGGISAGATANGQVTAPALSIETGHSGSDAAILVIETSVTGEVFVDGRAIGLVQDASRARFVTLIPGRHEVRVERLHAAPVLAQFYIDSGERISLRWESRQSR